MATTPKELTQRHRQHQGLIVTASSGALLFAWPLFHCGRARRYCFCAPQEGVARLCSRLPSSERLLTAYARLLASRLLPEWVIWGLEGGGNGSSERVHKAKAVAGTPLHIQLARARDAARAPVAAYRAFLEDDNSTSTQEVTAVDVFSAAAAKVCALELRAWETLHRSFEARCPVPPEEQWRIRQVIADIAAARDTLLLYTKHLQQGKCTYAAPTSAPTASADLAAAGADASTGQQLQQQTKPKQQAPAGSSGSSGQVRRTPSQPAAVTAVTDETAAAFEALVLTKKAWEVHLPLGDLGSIHPCGPPVGPEVPTQGVNKHLPQVDGLKIPQQLHAHLEVCSSGRQSAADALTGSLTLSRQLPLLSVLVTL